MATFEVKATLPYALRNPDCTKTDPEELMRMAARYIDELETVNQQLGDMLKRCQSSGLAIEGLVRELDVALNGEDGAASHPRLCDVVAQVKDGRWKLVRQDSN